jgi:opacity protein-like surface antigen
MLALPGGRAAVCAANARRATAPADPNRKDRTFPMKRAMVGLLAAAAIAGGAGHARAQGGTLPVSLQVRLDAGLPLGDFKDGTKAGLGWGVDGAFDVAPNLSVFVGYSSFDFDIKDSDLRVRDDGVDVGTRLRLGTGGGVLSSYAQFAALFHNGETGFEAGLGAEYPVSPAVTVTPLARYRKVADTQYVGLGIGLMVRP